MPANDFIITASWVPNKYTVKFDVSGGYELEKNEVTVTFDSAYRNSLPVPTRKGHTFIGWVTEEDETITSEGIVEIADNHTLYARWEINSYRVTFEYDNGSKTTEALFEYDENVTYPEDPEKRGYTFNGWDMNPETMLPNNITIEATWTPNKYTVKFDVSGGDELEKNKMTVTFDSAYGDSLPVPTRKGHTFIGWVTEKNEIITSETIVNTTEAHALYAQWKEIQTSQVEIIFETKDLSDETIKEILEKFTDAEFTIMRVEDSETGELRVIIKFVGIEEAEEFVKAVKESSDSATTSYIREVDFNSEKLGEGSFSFMNNPFFLLGIYMF